MSKPTDITCIAIAAAQCLKNVPDHEMLLFCERPIIMITKLPAFDRLYLNLKNDNNNYVPVHDLFILTSDLAIRFYKQ